MYGISLFQDLGYLALPIRSPTVAKGTERLRIVLHAHNIKSEVTGLFDALVNFFRIEADMENDAHVFD